MDVKVDSSAVSAYSSPICRVQHETKTALTLLYIYQGVQRAQGKVKDI